MAKQFLVGSGSCGHRTYASVRILKSGRRPGAVLGWSIAAAFGVSSTWKFRRAQRLRYCVSIACIAADRRSPEDEEPAVAVLAERVTPLIRATDVVTCWNPPCLALMLVDADVASLPSIVDRLTTRLEMYLWSAGGASYPKAATRADDLFHQALHMMMQAQRDGGSRLYLPT